MVLSFIALALGVGPGWPFLWTGRLREYDPTIAVLTATLIALIWTANYTYHAVLDARERDELESSRRQGARNSLLAGVASECETIDSALEVISERLYHARVLRVERPMFGEVLRNTHLLLELEVGVITKLSMSLALIDSGLADLVNRGARFRSDYLSMSPSEIEKQFPESVKALRWIIASARQRLPELSKMLSPTMYALSKWKKEQPVGE